MLPISRAALQRSTLAASAVAATSAQQVRYLNLQEYASKVLLREQGVRVQPFFVAESAEQVPKELQQFKAPEYVVKAQILAGGRGKGTFSSGFKGGVKLTTDPKEVQTLVSKMLGQRLVTKQTPAEGSMVNKVMVAKSINITRETYLAILLDRATSSPVIIASPEGGVEIEEVAEKNPSAIHKEVIDMDKGITDEQARKLARFLKFTGKMEADAALQIKGLYELFMKIDATQVEINPLAETDESLVYCVDAKLNFDDSAAYRQQRIFAMEEQDDIDPREAKANQYNLNYIPLEGGTIACMVNGAGLAMATMDVVKMYGAEPANFLDVGGRVDEEAVGKAFELILSDKSKVKAILVNIFGGIVDCTLIAKGLIAAFKKMSIEVPLVVRLEGTNAKQALELLSESKLPIKTASDLDSAAKTVVGLI